MSCTLFTHPLTHSLTHPFYPIPHLPFFPHTLAPPFSLFHQFHSLLSNSFSLSLLPWLQLHSLSSLHITFLCLTQPSLQSPFNFPSFHHLSHSTASISIHSLSFLFLLQTSFLPVFPPYVPCNPSFHLSSVLFFSCPSSYLPFTSTHSLLLPPPLYTLASSPSVPFLSLSANPSLCYHINLSIDHLCNIDVHY